jgi:hypothetical protein
MDAPRRPIGTFGELEQQALAIRVTCQRCGHQAIVDPGSPPLRDRQLAGQRFRCTQLLPSGKKCGGIGLPSIEESRLGPARRWPDRLAAHARKLREK